MKDKDNLSPETATSPDGDAGGETEAVSQAGRKGRAKAAGVAGTRRKTARAATGSRKAAGTAGSGKRAASGTGRKTRAAQSDEPEELSPRVAGIVAHLRDGEPLDPMTSLATPDDAASPPDGQTAAAPAADPAEPGRRSGRGGAARVIELRPPAGAARVRRRHRGVILSFVLVVILPLILAMSYLFLVAQDEYASTVGFTVRREQGSTSSTELLGGLAQFAGSSGSSESDILYEYIQSQEIVSVIDERIGLGNLYAVHWPGDPLMSLWPNPTIEDLHWFWKRMVRISYDQSTRLIELRVLAFSAEDAQRIATEIVAASQNRINDLNNQSRSDVMRYATEDLETALARLKAAREALSRFRTRTQIVDPSADIQGRMGVLNNLQQQLAQALIDNDIVLGTTQQNDPRREQAARRIQVIRDRIADERKTFSSDVETNIAGENYPALIAEFESLTVDLQFAEETYRASLAAVDVARANASRQTLYLAPYITPTLPQTAEFPQRIMLSGLIGLFLLLAWSIGALIYYSVRDRN